MTPFYWKDGTLAYRIGEPGWLDKVCEVEAKLMDLSYKRIGHTVLPNGMVVSTVWLGYDAGPFINGRPAIFETMVFRSDDDFRSLGLARYSTEENARAGHEEMVSEWAKRH